jgi:hypothetical protein
VINFSVDVGFKDTPIRRLPPEHKVVKRKTTDQKLSTYYNPNNFVSGTQNAKIFTKLPKYL